MKTICKIFLSVVLLIFCHQSAFAGVIIGGTRLIYEGDRKEVSMSVTNPDNVAYLIQSWIEPEQTSNAPQPFVITPPLFRLDSEQKNIFRVIRIADLPRDRESLFWLNIKSIPATKVETSNVLQMAVKIRIKLIYRPPGLLNNIPETYIKKLEWKRVGNNLEIINPGAYYINFNHIAISGVSLNDVSYIAPFGSVRFALPEKNDSDTIVYEIINDYGGVSKSFTAKI